MFFINLLLYLVEKDVAIVADNHTEARQRLPCLVELVKHIADCLWAVPVTWFAPVGEADAGDTVDTEWAHLLGLNVVHEESQETIVLVKLHALGFILQGVLIAEVITQDMSLKSLEQQHLACAQHAAPTCITCMRGLAKWMFNFASVGEPCHCGKRCLEFVCHQLEALLILSIFCRLTSREEATSIARDAGSLTMAFIVHVGRCLFGWRLQIMHFVQEES